MNPLHIRCYQCHTLFERYVADLIPSPPGENQRYLTRCPHCGTYNAISLPQLTTAESSPKDTIVRGTKTEA